MICMTVEDNVQLINEYMGVISCKYREEEAVWFYGRRVVEGK